MATCLSSPLTHRASLNLARAYPRLVRHYVPPLTVENKTYTPDAWTNATPTILSRIPRKLYLNPRHPVGILKDLIESEFGPDYHKVSGVSPVVTVQENFDDLNFPADHPGRSRTDSYYLTKDVMLRTHTSAHEVANFRAGYERFVISADVYRRDEIDASHYPVFHQMEGCNVMNKADLGRFARENAEMEKELASANIEIHDDTREFTESNPIQSVHSPEEARVISDHLKNTLNKMILNVLGGRAVQNSAENANSGGPLQVRWIEATFPWTAPSYEVEVLYNGKWLEILGCGVVRQETLDVAGIPEKAGWAFGLGLERIAMVLFGIPDIRLFWSEDPRFIEQFTPGVISTFVPYSKYPACYKDVSFWVPEGFHENDFCDAARDVAGDLIETVEKIDEFEHPKTHQKSLCYRLNYRSMDQSLSNDFVNELHAKVTQSLVDNLHIKVR